MTIGNYSIIKTSVLENQERAFEAKLEARTSILQENIKTWEEDYQELFDRHIKVLKDYEHNLTVLEVAQANEQLLNNQTGKLAQKLHSAITFPDKNFSVAKAIDLLTNREKITKKTVATLFKRLIEVLEIDLVETIQRYSKTKIEKNEKSI